MNTLTRYRYWWYDYVKKTIMHNIGSTQQPPETMQEATARIAITKALDDMKQLHRGEERLELIDLVYRKQRYTVPGAALALHVSEGTAANWAKDFMYTVAKHMGFL